MSYSNKLNTLRQLEEQKVQLIEQIKELYSSIVSEQDTTSGPKAENSPKKIKLIDNKKLD